MFSSPPSEPRTVLLWGDRWWVAGHGLTETFSDLAQAKEILVEHFRQEPKPVRLRLVYQPDSFTSVASPCPPGNRATLAAALAHEFPALARDDLAWSHDPILSKDGEHSTILHFEREPGLFGLAGELAHAGLAVESAWPLAAYLPALLKEWTDSGAFTVVTLHGERACGYRHSTEGLRCVRQWLGASALTDVPQWLEEIFAEDRNEPILVLVADEAAQESMRAFAGPERPGTEIVPLSEVLGRRHLLPRYHSAQLLPKPPAFTAQRAVIAAGLICLLAAGWIGATHAHQTFVSRVARESRQKAASELRDEIAHLRANQTEIITLRRLIERGAAGPPCGALLTRLGTAVPAELVLSSIHIQTHGFEAVGWVAPAAPAGLLENWRSALARDAAPWTTAIRPGAGGGFTVTGSFRP